MNLKFSINKWLFSTAGCIYLNKVKQSILNWEFQEEKLHDSHYFRFNKPFQLQFMILKGEWNNYTQLFIFVLRLDYLVGCGTNYSSYMLMQICALAIFTKDLIFLLSFIILFINQQDTKECRKWSKSSLKEEILSVEKLPLFFNIPHKLSVFSYKGIY